MKAILAILCLALLPSAAEAGLLFGSNHRVTIINNGGASGSYSYNGGYGAGYGYGVGYGGYGRSYSYRPIQTYAAPTYTVQRTYRTYSAPVQNYPVQVYVAPAPIYAAPVAAAPVIATEPAPAQDPCPPVTTTYRTYSSPIYSSPVYAQGAWSSYSLDDDGPMYSRSKVSHKERHRHGKHKVSHKESSRE